jgi:putative Mg2+ transporter-C (MgtC) family protein
VSPEAQLDVLTRVIVALLLGAIIGIEREYRGHPAGVRTLAMVSVGSCIFTAAGLFILPGHASDPTRIAAQIVTGVGFLGAGAIFRSDDGIKGLTTAATVWVVAAIGMVTGFGLFVIAAGGALLVLVALALIRPIELRFLHRTDHPMRRHDDELTGEEPAPHQ